jgi:hypothetical protein
MKKYIPIVLLVIFAIFCRFLPHPANFAPIGAIAMFGALYLPKKWSIIIPLCAMLASDIFIGLYNPAIMAMVYGGFLIMWFIGNRIKQKSATSADKFGKFSLIFGGTVLGSIIFFLLTNWAVWAFGHWYPSSLSGLLMSYLVAIPFFRNSLMGDLFYTSVFVAGFELLLFWQTKKQLQTSTQTIREIN